MIEDGTPDGNAGEPQDIQAPKTVTVRSHGVVYRFFNQEDD
ncbi:hypothetical protein BJ987_007081 [Nocardia goodfellowii]|uniref:Uncharacterized protein n=1 Tax=Nocardia goodfellowii TaxID=882446 RepID=A0ABS4QSP6_9NOCA|nr:hypothetical protein [Nocardia goodfellowii]